QIGINGNDIGGLQMAGVEVSGAGNELFEHGVQFVNLHGTAAVADSSFRNNLYRQFTVQNSTGNLSLAVSNSLFTSSGLASGAQGMLISGHGTATIDVSVTGSTFSNNLAAGYFSDGADMAALDVRIAGSQFMNNGGGVALAIANGASLAYDIGSNTLTGSRSPAVSIFKGSLSSGPASGTVRGNTIGTAGVPGSACGSGPCEAISLTANGVGDYAATVTGNEIRNFRTRAIGASMAEDVTANLTIDANTIAEPAPGAGSSIFVQSGTLPGHTSSVCSSIQGNVISGSYATGILVRNRFPSTTFRLPGYSGGDTDTTAVAAYLAAQNGGALATATTNGNAFGGGAACPTP
ncbi:MAG TPA: hypothetical protein VFT12_07545, partial [Thermoanaerobaculia bacterium]|nr:hypothetical protein [Thermoanaerobaculia bacterium]